MKQPVFTRAAWAVLVVLVVLVAPLACDKRSEGEKDVLTLGAYTTPREVYGSALIPAFRARWQAQTGRELEVRESYLGSGAQARAIAAGFEADVAALSLEPDIVQLERAKLITHDWKSGPTRGVVTRSLVVIGVRPGNPQGIHDWQDLTRPGVEVLTPNVRTSGGAMWNVMAVYGAARRGQAGVKPDEAVDLLARVLANVRIMDRSARDSMLTFERGVGDAIITYENEMLVGQKKGKQYEYVIPRSTVLIENPVAVVDGHTRRHGSELLARAFVEFLVTPEAQRTYADHGLRPVSGVVEAEVARRFPEPGDVFTVEDLGGWAWVERDVFGEGAVYDRAVARARKAPSP